MIVMLCIKRGENKIKALIDLHISRIPTSTMLFQHMRDTTNMCIEIKQNKKLDNSDTMTASVDINLLFFSFLFSMCLEVLSNYFPPRSFLACERY